MSDEKCFLVRQNEQAKTARPSSRMEQTPLSFKNGHSDSRTKDLVESKATLSDYEGIIELTSTRCGCFVFADPPDIQLPIDELTKAFWKRNLICTISNTALLSVRSNRLEEEEARKFGDFFPETEEYKRLLQAFVSSQFLLEEYRLKEKSENGEAILRCSLKGEVLGGKLEKVWVLQRDVTQVESAVAELELAEEHYRSLVESPGQVLVRVTPDGKYLYISPSVEELTGVSPREFASNPGLFRTLLHPDDVEAHETIYRARHERSQETIEVEYRVQHKDGEYHWMLERQIPKLRPDGEVDYFDCIALDVQDMKQLQLDLVQAEKMTTVGTLAAGIAHDFNNHLTAMLGQLNLALLELKPGTTPYSNIAAAEQAALCCAEMTRHLLEFGRKSNSNSMEPLNIKNLVEDTVSLLSHLLPASVHIDLSFDHELPGIKGSTAQLQQVMVNLLINARDALQEEGVIRIYVRHKPLFETRPKHIYPNAEPGRYVEVSVFDTGTGIAEDKISRIFDPFYTTKENGRGTGLGLSMVYSIVRDHGGWMQVSSKEGVGTNFQFIVPALGDATEFVEEDDKMQDLKGSEYILVAEDEELVLQMVRTALSLQGYSVITAPDGEAALKAFHKRRDKIALAFIDFTMPKISGREVVLEIREHSPELPIILTSGYSREFTEEFLQQNGRDMAFVSKPYPLPKLLEMIKAMIKENTTKTKDVDQKEEERVIH